LLVLSADSRDFALRYQRRILSVTVFKNGYANTSRK